MGRKSTKITYTKRGKMLTGRKASLYTALTGPFRAIGNAFESRRNARSAKRIMRRR